MNKWEQVAKLFDLELNEEFELLDENGEKFEGKYYFSNEGIMDEHTVCYGILNRLLYDGYTIIKKPWKPKMNGNCNYWCYSISAHRAINEEWFNDGFDYVAWKIGNCFKTKEEAETKGKEIMEKIIKEYDKA